jgi:type VI secretion system secreted protein VgrG
MARIFELTSPLGQDLLFRSLHGREELARLSEFDLSAVSTRPDIGPGDLLGKSLTVQVDLRSTGEHRYFNGYVTRFAQGGMAGRHYEYRMTVRPWLWFLTRTADCRIFQDKKAPEIIKEVFKDRGFTDFESKLTDEGSYPKLEYCVQYRETDLNFVSRLMEKEGIYYFFKHSGGKHTLVLADSKSSHQPIPGRAKMPFHPPSGEFARKEERIYEWISERRFRTGKIELNDYNYLKPNANMLSDAVPAGSTPSTAVHRTNPMPVAIAPGESRPRESHLTMK